MDLQKKSEEHITLNGAYEKVQLELSELKSKDQFFTDVNKNLEQANKNLRRQIEDVNKFFSGL